MNESVNSCLFSLCKIYTYATQVYNKYFAECIHYYTNNDIDIKQPFYNYEHQEFYINTLSGCNPLSTMNQSSDFIVCDYSFLNITVTFKEQEYQLELDTKLWNFYCVGNVIDFEFIYWYMTYNYGFNDFDKNFTWVILDNNFDFIELDCNSSLLLYRDSYSILNT